MTVIQNPMHTLIDDDLHVDRAGPLIRYGR